MWSSQTTAYLCPLTGLSSSWISWPMPFAKCPMERATRCQSLCRWMNLLPLDLSSRLVNYARWSYGCMSPIQSWISYEIINLFFFLDLDILFLLLNVLKWFRSASASRRLLFSGPGVVYQPWAQLVDAEPGETESGTQGQCQVSQVNMIVNSPTVWSQTEPAAIHNQKADVQDICETASSVAVKCFFEKD